ncbi:rCG45628 [Rattus norvegicus]|uniref:Lipocalin 13 n=2 Tax=Rattus norvegicus TaxID=10116 RepID=A6JTA2_RAT|nr:odorant binding protein 2A precursor [Rattus norvegicus]ABG24236.1 lipocalin 13 [Rattus norvegicus]EDL93545.1 rCG45628 [Rattus norvegicus]|eukprot:NP_001121611.1 odorant binding protein 2A precursor [Rattus norvegicus]
MKSLLLTVLLLELVAVLKAQELLLDDQEDYSGTWYPKAMVHNGSLPHCKLPTRVFPVKVIALEDGDLEATVTVWKDDRCHEFKFVMRKTKEPGIYSTFHGKKTVHVEKTSVEGHYIFYCEGLHNGKSFGMGKLMGRNPEENPEAMEEFKKFIQRMELQEENMFVPEIRDECVNESD